MSIIKDPLPPKPLGRDSKSRQVISLLVLVGVILAFAVLFYHVIRPMFLPLFLAAVFALLAMPLQRAMQVRWKWPAWAAALAITLMAVLVWLAPTTAGFFLLKERFQQTVTSLEKTVNDPEKREQLFAWVGDRVPVDPEQLEKQGLEALREGEVILFQRAMQALGSVTAFLLGSLLFLFAGFFFLKDGPAILRAWEEITPLDVDQDRQIRERFAVVCRGVVLSTLLAALAQAVTLGLCILLLDLIFGVGLGSWIFLIVLLTVITAMIPIIGPFVVWIPLVGYMIYQGQYVPAAILTVFASIVVGNIDNLVRILVLKGTVQMHPLMGLISILGGVQLLGVVGIFVGPVVAAVFVSLLRILRLQLLEFERPAAPATEKVRA